MKTVAITAPTGMLGSMVYNVLKDKYHIVLIYRDEKKLRLLDKVYGEVRKQKKLRYNFFNLYDDYARGFYANQQSPSLEKLYEKIGKIDAIVNCAGVIKPYSTINPLETLFINGAIPQILSTVYGQKLIHITTDCVFSGLKGAPYTEDAIKTANDLYGLSKSLGESSEHSLVLRTSIIGPELSGFLSLVEWAKKQKGEIQGFTNHYWNGITTKEFGRICDNIIAHRNQFPATGLFHIFGSDVTKHKMLQVIQKKYNIPVMVKPNKSIKVDRRLGTNYDFCKKLSIPSFEEMMQDL